jgi:hypothetical protein
VADPVVCSDDAKSEASQIETGPLRLPLAPRALIDALIALTSLMSASARNSTTAA